MSEMIQYRSFKPRKYPISQEIHDAIERVYKRDTGNGQVRALAIRLNFPRWKITRYAIQMGWVPKQKKEPDWSEQEMRVLKLHAHKSPEVVQRKLKASGFARSVTGIVLKRKRMRLLKNLEGMSARGLAQCLGVDEHFVIRAIKKGKLKAERRGTKRTEIQGGDIYFMDLRGLGRVV